MPDPGKASILSQEITELLQKDAIEVVDPRSKGFYSTFFVVPKKDGGLRPILNLKPLNRYIVYKNWKNSRWRQPSLSYNTSRRGIGWPVWI
jgi:hypothetical protein